MFVVSNLATCCGTTAAREAMVYSTSKRTVAVVAVISCYKHVWVILY